MTGRFAFGWDRCGDVSGVDSGAPLDSGTVSPARTALRAFGAATAALLLVAGLAGPALGHAELDTADPADKAVLQTPPTTITLTFTEDLDPSKSSFKLLAPDGSTVGTGGATAIRTMSLDNLELAPGAYQIKWTSASAADGDIARGELAFTVAQPAPGSASKIHGERRGVSEPVGVERRGRDPGAERRDSAHAGPIGRAERARGVDRRRPPADHRRPDPRRRGRRLRPAPKPRGVARPAWA